MTGKSNDNSVVLFARKTLENNTRIFKQAKTLTEEGYNVTLIGIQPGHLPAEEEQEGYTIVRVGRITPEIKKWRNALKKLFPLYPLYIVLKWFLVHFFSLFRAVTRRSVHLALQWSSRLRSHIPDLISWGVNVTTSLSYRHLRIAKIRWYIRSRIIRLRTRFRSPTSDPIHRGGSLFQRLVGWSRDLPKRVLRSLNRFFNYLILQPFFHGRWFLLSYNYYRKSYRVMKECDLDPDVVQANDLNTLVVAVIAARHHSVPLYYDTQELYTEVHTLPRWYKYVLMIQEFVLIRFADRVTVVNPFIAEVMEKRYGREVDEVILNCPPLNALDDFDTRPGTTASEKFNIDPDVPVVLYSGGLTTQRGLENLIKAMADVTDTELVILGEGSLRNELEAMTIKYDIEERVHFSEYVPHEEVPTFIASADIGVVPYEHVGMNHYLCSPSKLFHYIMAELVIVGSAFPFLSHVIGDNDIGDTFDPEDHESMAETISDIVEDPERLQRHRENTAEAKHRYTWETEAEKFLAQYIELHGQLSSTSLSKQTKPRTVKSKQ